MGQLRQSPERIDVHGEPVILGGDLDRARLQVLNRVVGPVVTEPELVGFSPERQPDELMAQADAEERDFPDYFSYAFDGVGYGLWVSRPVGEKDAVGL